jgi:hypothetical protein
MGRGSPSSPRVRTLGRLERAVTALVEAPLHDGSDGPPNLVQRLRLLGRSVLDADCDPQDLQVIASGRRLLGDADEPGTFPEPSGIAFDDDLT